MVDGETLAINASIGTAVMSDAEDFETILERADRAMYDVKRGS